MNKKEIISKSDFIISFASMLADNREDVRDSVIESIAKTNATFVYMHPIDNIDLKLYYNQFIKYEVGSEEGVCSLLLDTFVKQTNENIQNYIDDLDLGYISAESSAGEEEFEEAYEFYKNANFKTLIIGNDIIEHDRLENIVKFLSIIKRYTDFNLIVLDEKLEEKINSCMDEDLEEVEDLKSYNGTLVYRLEEDEPSDELNCSVSFSNIAKVHNGDTVFVNYQNEKIEKVLKVDEKLSGTVGILKTNQNNDELFKDYRFKQVKIEKVDA
jgi:NADH-quinone oxidoreductase subunit F